MKRLIAVMITLAAAGPVSAAPQGLEDLLAHRPDAAAPGIVTLAGEKRASAMRAAAIAWGSRAGLAHRSSEIAHRLDRLAPQLDGVFRFRELALRQDGFMVLPPVLAETRAAFRLGDGGDRAATAARVMRILEPARIISAAPSWRDWLTRNWLPAGPPAALLFPRDGKEAARWEGWIREGWDAGRRLADDVFAADLDRLRTAFEGMALWHRAMAGGMVSSPVVSVIRTSVAGDVTEMRIREATAALTGRAELNLDARSWLPLPEGTAQ